MRLHKNLDTIFADQKNKDLVIKLADLIGLDESFKEQSKSTTQLYWNQDHRDTLIQYIKDTKGVNLAVLKGLFEKRGFLLRGQLIDIHSELTLEDLLKGYEAGDSKERDCAEDGACDECDPPVTELDDLLVQSPDFMELTNTLAVAMDEEWRSRIIQVKKYKRMVVVAFTLE
jgi:hypothetical protein